ncbi:SoxR reducing system RseC family protein [Niveibacterium sp. 24ML]|uniref:SoxR reducing system RseC family protein n=1 Tax=Niveibacterium sp. 24ML TaxID=2985512 RepID=UPI0022714F85|nr:SoxR reducing system RseC family protein [Niveibacterium sp. 24ML]MCX9158280.1 SoxR reducing system RseC family protein [Niveibacterium sp. 24ML]
MNVRKAVVLRMEGAAAIVKLDAQGGCGRCAESGGCGSDVLGQLFGPRCRTYQAEALHPFAAGSEVEVSVEARAPLIAALLAYGVPLIGLLLGASLGALFGGDAAAAGGAVAGLVLSAIVATAAVRRRGAQLRVRILETDQTGS